MRSDFWTKGLDVVMLRRSRCVQIFFKIRIGYVQLASVCGAVVQRIIIFFVICMPHTTKTQRPVCTVYRIRCSSKIIP